MPSIRELIFPPNGTQPKLPDPSESDVVIAFDKEKGVTFVQGSYIYELALSRRDELVARVEGGGYALFIRMPDDSVMCYLNSPHVALFATQSLSAS